MRRTLLCCANLVLGALLTRLAGAQTFLNGKDLALRSSGLQSGNGWSLSGTGYLGTYITIPAGGSTVSFTVNATEGASGSGTPRMNLVVADTKVPFDVSSASPTDYSASVSLPAGTYFVRTERDYPSNTSNTQPLTINSLSMNTTSGGTTTFSNTNTATIALAAADSYIANFRKGPATVALTGPNNIPLLVGTPVNVDLARNAFNFGNAVPGNSSNNVGSYLGNNSTAQQTNYQAKLNQNFNAIVPENAGKWANNEFTRDINTMTGVDTILNYAQSHHMAARMHNMIWGGQQPSWVSTGTTSLLSKAAAGDATAKQDLRDEISERVGYYVGTGVAGDRANKYSELDIYNESYHTGSQVSGSYWNVYTPTGIADIYRQVHAVAPNVKLYTNEYNIYADTNDGSKYANYYQQHIESLRSAGIAAGYGDVVSGIGTQYYVNNATDVLDPNRGGAPTNAHNPARIMQTIQNLATEGVPVTLTEFGVKSGATSTTAATMLSDALRITYGNAAATGFFMWGFQAENGGSNLFAPAAALYTVNTADWNTWTITDSGKAWQDLLGIQDWDGNPNNAWTTHVTPTVDANGNITFNGFFGDYNVGNQSGFKNLTLVKGTSGYSLSLAAPPTWSFWNTANTGAWSAGSNWSSGGIPNAAGRTAYFGPAGAARSVNVDSPQTVGMMALDSANSYTFNGPSTITLSGSAGVAAIYVNNGSHQIGAPLALNNDTTVTVVPSNSVLTVTNLQPSNVALTKAGSGALVVNNVRANSLNASAGSLTISQNGTDSGTSNVQALSVAGASTLDLTDNALVVDYGGASPLATIKSQLISGYAGGDWTGNGITSSIAAAVAVDGSNLHKTALGYAEASALGIATFAGQGIDDTAVLVRYTLTGDANLDLMVDTVDFNLMAANFGANGLEWSDGNFNFDNTIDTIDFNLLASNFSMTLAAPAGKAAGIFVPEPASLAILTLGISQLLLRKRKCD